MKNTVLPKSLICLCFLPTIYVTCLSCPITSFVIKTLTLAPNWTAIAQKSQHYFDSSLVLPTLGKYIAAQFAKRRHSPICRFCIFHTGVTTATKFSTLHKPSNPMNSTNSSISKEISITIWKRWGMPHVWTSHEQRLFPLGQCILYVVAVLCWRILSRKKIFSLVI